MCRREKKSGRVGERQSRRIRYLRLLLCCTTALLLFLPGCSQEMANQPRFEPMEPVPGLAHGLASLGPVKGTVARGQLASGSAFVTGKENDQLVTQIPPEALEGRDMGQLMDRGQQRFVVFCIQCHGQVGGGTGGSEEMASLVGMVVKRGFPAPPTFHQPRLRDAPVGHFFDVITNGLGRMPAHGYLIPPEDRWAIAAYIRALQLSQNAPRDELTAGDLRQLQARAGAP
jgi:mono/diheme cytochrome c family protein